MKFRLLACTFLALLLGVVPAAASSGPSSSTRRDLTFSAPVDARVPAEIPRDCSVDVTEALQAWIDAQPDGSADDPRVLDLGRGCYALGSTAAGDRGAGRNLGPRNGLLLINRKFLELRGSAQFVALVDAPLGTDGYHVNRALIWMENCENIVIGGLDLNRDGRMGPKEMLRFRGRNPAGSYDPHLGREQDHAIRVMGGQQILVKYATAVQTWGDNVYVSPGPDPSGAGPMPWGPNGEGATPARGITVRDSVLRTAGRHSVSCVGCDGLTLTRNQMSDAGYWVIDLEQQLRLVPIQNVVISQNTASVSRYGFTSIGAVEDSPIGISNVLISGNTFARSETCYEFVSINGRTGSLAPAPTVGITIRNNRLRVNQYGISARAVRGLDVTGNRGYTRTSLKCAAADSTPAPDKVFGLVAVKDGVGDVTVTGNSFLRLSTDSPTVRTASVVTTIASLVPPEGMTDCSNRTTASIGSTFDQPAACPS